jgi:cysteinyl-tRNA synthetase
MGQAACRDDIENNEVTLPESCTSPLSLFHCTCVLEYMQAACGCGHDHDHGSHASNSASSSSPAFVRYWLHNGFVNVDSEKMSKSLGNFFTIRDVLQSYHPAALRWFLVSSQYRTPLNYTQRGLDEASDRVYYVYQTLDDAAALLAGAGEPGAAALKAAAEAVTPAAAAALAAAGDAAAAAGSSGVDVVAAVLSGLCDDLNTPQSVSALSAPLKSLNDLMTTKAGRKNPKR